LEAAGLNNVCYRKCLWNFNNKCIPETDSNYKDGTATTKNCSQFLHKDFFKNMDNVLTECNLMLLNLTNKQLRQARHAIKQIKTNKEKFVCGGCCLTCKHKTPCEAIRKKEAFMTEQKEYCPCDKRCEDGKYYGGWCYGGLCEDALKINKVNEDERINKANKIKQERNEYIMQLKASQKYFDVQKTLLASINFQGFVALNIANKLIQKELDNLIKE